jgi:radical SAM-linked protein
VFRRSAGDPQVGPRDAATAWEVAVIASGLPVVLSGASPPRPRLVIAASLPHGAGGEVELADLLLHQARPVWDVRQRLVGHLPAGVELIDLYDVWLGEPALPALVIAADWQVTLKGPPPVEELRAASAQLLASATVPRQRTRGTAGASYDLRPLIDDIRVEEPTGELRLRTRFHPERGVGRPEEVVGALGERLGQTLTVDRMVRTALILAPAKPDSLDRTAGHQLSSRRQRAASAASRRGRK